MSVPPHPSNLAVASMLVPDQVEIKVYGISTLCTSGLLVISAGDGAWISLGSAPAVAPGVSALVFPLGILKQKGRNPGLATHQQRLHSDFTKFGNKESEV